MQVRRPKGSVISASPQLYNNNFLLTVNSNVSRIMTLILFSFKISDRKFRILFLVRKSHVSLLPYISSALYRKESIKLPHLQFVHSRLLKPLDATKYSKDALLGRTATFCWPACREWLKAVNMAFSGQRLWGSTWSWNPMKRLRTPSISASRLCRSATSADNCSVRTPGFVRTRECTSVKVWEIHSLETGNINGQLAQKRSLICF